MAFRQTLTLVAAAAIAAACSGDGPGYKDPILGGVGSARLRVVNAAPAIPSAQLYVASSPVGSTVARWTSAIDCVDVAVGQPLSFRTNVDSVTLVTLSNPELTAGGAHTIVLWGSVGALQATVLSDDALPTPGTTQTALRFFNTTSAPGDVYVTPPEVALSGLPSVSNLAVGQETRGGSQFVSYPVASTLVRMYDVGVRDGLPRIAASASQAALSTTRTWTMVLTEESGIGGANLSFVVPPCETP